jgi:hypothetical protein
VGKEKRISGSKVREGEGSREERRVWEGREGGEGKRREQGGVFLSF